MAAAAFAEHLLASGFEEVGAARVARHLQFKRDSLKLTSYLQIMPSDFADNRAWTNPENKSQLGCIGRDYVKDSNLLVFRYFWNDTHQVLAGTCEFTSATEGPPGTHVCRRLFRHSAWICAAHTCVRALLFLRDGQAARTERASRPSLTRYSRIPSGAFDPTLLQSRYEPTVRYSICRSDLSCAFC